MARRIAIPAAPGLEDHAAVAHLVSAVQELMQAAAPVARALAGRTLWMVNSTAQGGGVSEMLPTMVQLLRELGFAVEWVVLESDRPEFFALTKQIHNLIHGTGSTLVGQEERDLFESVNAANAAQLRQWIKPGDVLIVHDPQPLPLAGQLSGELDLVAIWRCHIGLDEVNSATRAAWEFLEPYTPPYARAVFSAPEYVPPFLADRATVIYPAINPLTEKNRHLHLHTVVDILVNGGLSRSPGPLVRPPFPEGAQRLQLDGSFGSATDPDDFGLLTRPIVTQVSRWDRLKGFVPLLEAFVRVKQRSERAVGTTAAPLHRRRLQLARLVLAGPDPRSIQDDPEGQEMLAELRQRYLALDAALQEDVAILWLPMTSARQNALMVNALQRASTIIVQNSLREGFGLTITEAMWKRIPVLTNRRACGPRQQVRDNLDGRLVEDPEDAEGLAEAMDGMLADAVLREAWGRTAQRRAHDLFLIYTQLRSWLGLLADVAA